MLRILYALLLSMCFVGCSMAVKHQRQLGALHTQVKRPCVAQPATCRDLRPCEKGLHGAIDAWQRVSRLAAGQTADPRPAVPDVTLPAAEPTDPAIATADALIQEAEARHTCAEKGVK